jgi:hypothetical protein
MTNVPHIYLCLITNCVEAVPGGAEAHSCALGAREFELEKQLFSLLAEDC